MIRSFTESNFYLSNFYEPAVVLYEGEEYPTTEHAFQAAKTLDVRERQEIQEAPTPGRAKKLGRKATLRFDWDEIKIDVMLDLVRQKFQNWGLQQKLLSTGDVHLEEGNTWGDEFWGTCDGKGHNHLGKILMRVRDEVRGETAA